MIKYLTHNSHALKGFPMGDPHVRQCPVYLPPNYDAAREDPYPVVFMLAGYVGFSEKMAWEKNAFQKSLPEQLDEAILTNSMAPVIVVFPDGTNKLGGAQYINSPVLGHYMDYICDELTALIDAEFNTHKSADYRAIMGHSSGGFAALVTGMLRPDAFKRICSSAGDSFYELLYLPGITNTINAIEKYGSVTQFVHGFLSEPDPFATGFFNAIMTCAMAPCFAPNPKVETIMGDLFFDTKTGAIIDDVWQKYRAWDPVHMVDHHLEALKSLHYIQLDCGLQDPYGMQWGHRQIAEKLKAANISYTINEYPGKHSGHSWRQLSRIAHVFS
jgi:enterochelin esterase-like enzyme